MQPELDSQSEEAKPKKRSKLDKVGLEQLRTFASGLRDHWYGDRRW